MAEIISGLGLSTTFNLRKGGKGRQHFESKEIAHWNAHPDDLYLGSTLVAPAKPVRSPRLVVQADRRVDTGCFRFTGVPKRMQ